MEVDEPGKVVDSMRRVDQGFAPPVVAMLRAASALRKGEASGHVGVASEAGWKKSFFPWRKPHQK